MAPLRDTVRLVDREQRDATARQKLLGCLVPEALRCDVEQVKLPGQVIAFNGGAGARILSRIEKGRTNTHSGKRVDLVLHERDERRDHDTGALP